MYPSFFSFSYIYIFFSLFFMYFLIITNAVATYWCFHPCVNHDSSSMMRGCVNYIFLVFLPLNDDVIKYIRILDVVDLTTWPLTPFILTFFSCLFKVRFGYKCPAGLEFPTEAKNRGKPPKVRGVWIDVVKLTRSKIFSIGVLFTHNIQSICIVFIFAQTHISWIE